MASVIKAILEWLSGLIRSEVKQDVKATDAKVNKELRDRVRNRVREQLRDDAGRFRRRKRSDGKNRS